MGLDSLKKTDQNWYRGKFSRVIYCFRPRDLNSALPVSDFVVLRFYLSPLCYVWTTGHISLTNSHHSQGTVHVFGTVSITRNVP
jgi:hypothetical protein